MNNQVYGQHTFVRFVNANNTNIIQTLTHAHTIERFIKNKTFKYYLYRILDVLNQ